MLQVDSDTALYIQQVHPYFEDLRQIAAQLAGWLVLSAASAQSNAKTAGPEHPLLSSARRLYGNAREGVETSRPTPSARAHHRHLAEAARSLGVALDAARGIQIDPVLIPLRLACAQLERAARELPGFEMVEFSRGCCAFLQKTRVQQTL